MLVPIYPGSSHYSHNASLLSKFCPLHVLVDCTCIPKFLFQTAYLSPTYPYPTTLRRFTTFTTPSLHRSFDSQQLRSLFRYTMQFHVQIKSNITAVHTMLRSGLYQRTISCAITFLEVRVPLIFRIFVRHSCGGHLLVCTANIIYLGGRWLTNLLSNKQQFQQESSTCDVSFVRESLFGNYPEWKKAERT
jgi:hypothetical protein